MFKFLKDKLKSAVSRISKAIEKEEPVDVPLPPVIEVEEVFTKDEARHIEEVEVPAPPEEIVEKPKKEETPKIKEEPKKAVERPKEIIKEKPKEEKKEAIEEKKKEAPETLEKGTFSGHQKSERFLSVKEEPKETLPPKEEKKGMFARFKEAVTTTKVSPARFDELFWELEIAMLENNVAFEVIGKIKADLRKDIVEKPVRRGKVEDAVVSSLRASILSLFEGNKQIDMLKNAKEKKPYVIAFLGANGSGKTTTIAKLTNMFQSNGLKCVLAAGDTWRSAAIQQLEEHANKLNVPIVKHDYGADPAAIAFDAIEMAKARKLDVVLIDTAGRQHSNANLMDEMKKIIRVAKPDLKVYIGEMIAGNDCIEQIQSFDEAVGIDGVILSKADIDEKGGTAISVTYVTKKPILYLGMGQEYRDLEVFDKEKIVKGLGL